ncbi:single-stranded DNA-binding protein [Candidatus Uhrbacteria bacterium]|nr:single-stranded DNA-binding protein [Candidatus Uhrbacteria bacterium]
MALSLNKVMLIGNLTRDPETRTTTSGQTVSTFSVATSRSWKDQQGQLQEKTEFHSIVAWGKLGELCSQYLAKGRKAWVEGHLQTRDWTGEDGVKRYRTEIVAENVLFLDRPPAGSSPLASTMPPPPMSAPTIPASNADAIGAPFNEPDIKVEDIPF